MKKTISILITFIILISTTCISTHAVTYEMGDVNMDKNINIMDATTIQKFLAGLIYTNTSLADFDGNGIINVLDATAIQKYLTGTIKIYNGYLYTSENNRGTIIGYNGNNTSIVIPSYVNSNGDAIVSIGNSAFANKKITSVIIPQSVLSVGYYAFQNCNYLESVVIKNVNCHIDSSSFAGCTKLSYFVQG